MKKSGLRNTTQASEDIKDMTIEGNLSPSTALLTVILRTLIDIRDIVNMEVSDYEHSTGI